jgi:hypothetical protein
MTTDNCCFYFQNRLIPTSQTGGQQYSDTSPFSIPWTSPPLCICIYFLGRNSYRCLCVAGSTKANGREPKSCLGQVFNFKLGRFCYEWNCMTYTSMPTLVLKTWPRFCPVSYVGTCMCLPRAEMYARLQTL